MVLRGMGLMEKPGRALWLLLVFASLSFAPSVTGCKARRPASSAVQAAPPGDGPLGVFDLEREFPNPYLELLSDPVNPSAESLSQAKKLLVDTAFALFKRLTIFSVNGERVSEVNLYQQIARGMERLPVARDCVLSGGGIRELLGKITERVNAAKRENPGRNTREILNSLKQETGSLRYFETMGLGSDLDITVIAAQSIDDEAEAAEQLQEQVVGSRETIPQWDIDEGMRRVFLVRPDFKSFRAQSERTELQGGSTLDRIGLSLTSGEIVEPKEGMNTIEQYLKGMVDYALNAAPENQEKPLGTLVRAFRPLLSSPFLRLSPPSEAEVRRLTAFLKDKMRSGHVFPERELEQYDKMERCSREKGAVNRLLRQPPGTIEHEFYTFTQALEAYLDRNKSERLIHEFAESRSLLQGEDRFLPVPPTALMSAEDFLTSHTTDGFVYHGTKSLAVLRGGFFVSSATQGAAGYGRGVYMTPHVAEAMGYGKGGLVFQLGFVPNQLARAKIVDLPTAQAQPWFAAVQAEAARRTAAEGREVDVNEILAKDYGVDIIINKYVLIQNTGVLIPPQKLSDAYAALLRLASSESLPLEVRAPAATAVIELYKILSALHEAGLTELSQAVRKNLAREMIRRHAEIKKAPRGSGLRALGMSYFDVLAALDSQETWSYITTQLVHSSDQNHFLISLLTVSELNIEIEVRVNFLRNLLVNPGVDTGHQIKRMAMTALGRMADRSERAKGVFLVFLGSFPTDWDYVYDHLVAESPQFASDQNVIGGFVRAPGTSHGHLAVALASTGPNQVVDQYLRVQLGKLPAAIANEENEGMWAERLVQACLKRGGLSQEAWSVVHFVLKKVEAYPAILVEDIPKLAALDHGLPSSIYQALIAKVAALKQLETQKAWMTGEIAAFDKLSSVLAARVAANHPYDQMLVAQSQAAASPPSSSPSENPSPQVTTYSGCIQLIQEVARRSAQP